MLSAYKQIRNQEEPVLSDFDEDNFDRAFSLFRPGELYLVHTYSPPRSACPDSVAPVIQGTADVSIKHKLTSEELSKTIEFCAHAFVPTKKEDREAVLAKVHQGSEAEGMSEVVKATIDREKNLSNEEQRVLNHITARSMMRADDTVGISEFASDVVDGMRLRMTTGALGLENVEDVSAM